jgi:hypothetical protein
MRPGLDGSSTAPSREPVDGLAETGKPPPRPSTAIVDDGQGDHPHSRGALRGSDQASQRRHS